MAEITGADLLAKSLKEQGVEYMFGVVGFPVGPLAEAAVPVHFPVGSVVMARQTVKQKSSRVVKVILFFMLYFNRKINIKNKLRATAYFYIFLSGILVERSIFATLYT